MTVETETPFRLGVSACLLGEPVRFDGGHKRDFFLVDCARAFCRVAAGMSRAGVGPSRWHLAGQTYLSPHPAEFMPRNHV
jgi:hypothetical protein